MFRLYTALAILLSLALSDAFASSCDQPSEKELVATYEHIFVVFFTDATFFSDSDAAPFKGKIIANYDVLSVIKGDPDQVTHVEAKISGPNTPWPTTIPIGQKFILVANDGPAYWSRCSRMFKVPAEHFENCQEYSLRKFAGANISESRFCESEFLWQEFKRLKINPLSKQRDLEGLQAEWVEKFGILPE